MNKKWLILDCNYLCYRALFSMGKLNFGGEPTNVIYGFLKSLVAMQDFHGTHDMIFCWDYGKNLRLKLYPKYKENRKSRIKTPEEEEFYNAFRVQMRLLQEEYLSTIGFANIFYQRGYEGDDVMASVCHNLPAGDEGVIITSDQDLYQLISPRVSFFNPQKRKGLTLQSFKRQYGILPQDWWKVKTLAGCASDEVPGIKGVGEKTAIKYLKGFIVKGKVFDTIKSPEGRRIIKRNIPLVKLPMLGIRKFELKNDNLSEEGWHNVTAKLGMKSIQDKFPWKRLKKVKNIKK